jgi:hypothetical protein
VKPSVRVFFTHPRNADGLGDVRFHCLQPPMIHVARFAASTIASVIHLLIQGSAHYYQWV